MRKNVLLLVACLCALAVAQQGARYLIITTDALSNAVQPLAQWKHASGMMCKVTPLSQIGSDTTAIKNYIRNAYNTWQIKPEFVLLVGAPSALASRFYQQNGQQRSSYSSDNIYGDVTGDFQMDIPVGRFPARSAAQLDVMITKTLAYERNPDVSDSNWMRRMTTICRDLGDDDGWVYWGDARNAISLAAGAGFVGFDSLASSRGDTAPDIVNSVNRGTGLVLYRGTAVSNWYKPFNVNPAATANGSKLPVILSITCETMTLTPNESMVGDAWLKTGTLGNLKGGVAFFGNTHSGSNVAQIRSAVARGFFAGLFGENKYKLGHAMIRAKQHLYQQYPSYTADYRGFNLLGDPDLGIWTAVPRQLDVSRPAEIQPGPQQVEITVRYKLVSIANALVCLSMGTNVYSYGYTSGQGTVTLQVAPTDTGTMRLVVTGQNCYPYDGAIRVVPQTAVEESPRPAPAGPFRLTAAPSVFSRTTRLAWSQPLAGPGRIEILDARGRMVAGIPAATGLTAEWNGLDLAARPAKTGVYFCTLRDARGNSLDRVKVTKTR